MKNANTIRAQVERSSLGTKQARAARHTIRPIDAAKVVAKAAAERQTREEKRR